MKSNTYNCSFWQKGIFSHDLRLCGEILEEFLSASICGYVLKELAVSRQLSAISDQTGKVSSRQEAVSSKAL